LTGTSRISFARVAADTNALLSAAADAAAARVFREAADLIVTTTAFNLNETREHLPEIAAHFGIALDKLERALASLPLEVYGEEAYASHLEEARRFLAGRDPDDIPLAALALALSIPIWSGDKDFENVPVERNTTGKLLRALGL